MPLRIGLLCNVTCSQVELMTYMLVASHALVRMRRPIHRIPVRWSTVGTRTRTSTRSWMVTSKSVGRSMEMR